MSDPGHRARGETFEHRLSRQIRAGGPDECWPWTGALSPRGYGKTAWKGKHWRAHRAVWTLAHEEIPEGMVICHRCDNPRCCNLNHLFLGTEQDNIKDKIAKNRHFKGVGEKNAMAKLSAEQVSELRALRAAGWNFFKLGERYGVTFQHASAVAAGKIWRHVA